MWTHCIQVCASLCCECRNGFSAVPALCRKEVEPGPLRCAEGILSYCESLFRLSCLFEQMEIESLLSHLDAFRRVLGMDCSFVSRGDGRSDTVSPLCLFNGTEMFGHLSDSAKRVRFSSRNKESSKKDYHTIDGSGKQSIQSWE